LSKSARDASSHFSVRYSKSKPGPGLFGGTVREPILFTVILRDQISVVRPGYVEDFPGIDTKTSACQVVSSGGRVFATWRSGDRCSATN
jgi:hypothetical protein